MCFLNLAQLAFALAFFSAGVSLEAYKDLFI